MKKTLLSFLVVAALVASGCTHNETGNTGEDIPEISNSTDQASSIPTEAPVSSTSLPGGAPDFEPSPLSNSTLQTPSKVKSAKRHKKHSKKKHAKKKHGKKHRLANKKSSAESAE